MKLLQWLTKLIFFYKKPVYSARELEKLRSDFKINYHNFRLLLSANSKTLEIMSEIEEAISGIRPFGMSFVSARCSRVVANVYQIIRHLDEISSGKYKLLFSKFYEIQKELSACLSDNAKDLQNPLTVPIEKADRKMVAQVGGKMANLGELKRQLGVNIPDGYIITAHAFRQFMNHESLQAEIDKTIQSMEPEEFDHLYDISEAIRDLVQRASFPPGLAELIIEHHKYLEETYGREVSVAVRSSSPVEDLPGMSLAGQYHTELGVTSNDLLMAYKKVVASKYNYQSMIFRLNLGIRDEDVTMCVGVMPMVDAAQGGVIYTKDPVNASDDNLTIFSASGLPTSIVEGSTCADRFVISRSTPTRLVKKVTQQKDPLNKQVALELAKLALEIESYYGAPQDIEWVLDREGTITILQSRPLTRRIAQRSKAKPGKRDETAPTILNGDVTASPGIASGKAFVVLSEKDMLNFPDGYVLVVRQALPVWAAALGRAVAVVSQSGSVAGHLASVAREYGVPALFGVLDAVEKLSEGPVITVDADEMKIQKGSVNIPTTSLKAPVSHIQGSPVYKILKTASKYIVPLNLLDPYGKDFKIGRCKTLHDITRFCHEKVIKEMFSFGAANNFAELSGKQLHVDRPMQYWVINLDDGVKKSTPFNKRYVFLDNIVSGPMLSIWCGMTKIPWKGPPPVSAKGFFSIVAESAADTQLICSMPSKYANRNYFMISRDFASLHARVGYHYSTVEALVGETNKENYLSFLFKGGAASMEKRTLRAKLVAEILQDNGFYVLVVGDSVTARLDGLDKQRMKSGLKIVGHLIIHTRQLDMAMSGEASFVKYKQIISTDLERLLAPN